MKIDQIKNNFPIFKKKINNKPLVYLDSANSSQKPNSVIDRMSYFYENEFSNVGRSVHSLAVTATNRFEETRDLVKKFINAKHREEIIFTKGATEGINLVANSFGEKYINPCVLMIFWVGTLGIFDLICIGKKFLGDPILSKVCTEIDNNIINKKK